MREQDLVPTYKNKNIIQKLQYYSEISEMDG